MSNDCLDWYIAENKRKDAEIIAMTVKLAEANEARELQRGMALQFELRLRELDLQSAEHRAAALPTLDMEAPGVVVRPLGGWESAFDNSYGPPGPGYTEPGLREHWVYFIQGDEGGPIKIGRSRNLPWMRASDLQSGYPFGMLRVVAVTRAPAAYEQTLHARFASLRMVGEWFRAAPMLLALIRSLPRVNV
jgi:hypothetical protein